MPFPPTGHMALTEELKSDTFEYKFIWGVVFQRSSVLFAAFSLLYQFRAIS